jgi:putative heme transporter
VTPGEQVATGDGPDPKTRPAWVKPVVVAVILVVCAWVVREFVGRIDWDAVWAALTRLAWWQFPVLLAVLMVRQVMNALPLALFIKGLSVFRALVNDLTAAMMAVVAPPPSDMVLRIAMFKSWGIDASWGLAGATMNTLTFYINRFTAPVVGLAILLLVRGETMRPWAVAASAAVAVTIAVVLIMVVRSEAFAERTGAAGARLVRRFRSTVDADAWAAAAVQFQGNVSERFRRGLPLSLAGLVVMVLADATVLLLSLRFVGVSAAQLPTVDVIATFYIFYPLTLPPLMGLGVLDVALLGTFMEVGGDALEPEIVAALTVWRALTLLGPIILGVGASAYWRHSVRGSADSEGADLT